MRVQAQIPAALAALHNFIIQHDPMYNAAAEVVTAADPVLGVRLSRDGQRILDDRGELASSRSATEEESEEGKAIRDEIATAMWVDYQHYVARRTEAQRAEEERLELEARQGGRCSRRETRSARMWTWCRGELVMGQTESTQHQTVQGSPPQC